MIINERRHSTRVQCLEDDCPFEQSATNVFASGQLEDGAKKHARATGHRVMCSVLDRTTYGPDTAALLSQRRTGD